MSSMDFHPANQPLQTIALKSLVNDLAREFAPATCRNNSSLVNDVPAKLEIAGDPGMIANILRSLLHSMTSHVNESCMRVTAKAYSDVILVQVHDQHIHSSTLAYNMHDTQMIAERIGGFIGVTSHWNNETVVFLSFPNLSVAA